jgi:hypothetical protein
MPLNALDVHGSAVFNIFPTGFWSHFGLIPPFYASITFLE